MRLATMTTLFREKRGTDDHISYIESIQRCKETGFSVLDFNMCAMIHNKTELNGPNWEAELEKIKIAAQHYGVEFSQSHLPYLPGNKPYPAGSEEETFFDEITRRSLVASHVLGVKAAVVHPLTEQVVEEHSEEANLKLNHQFYDSIVEEAAKLNVNIAFENMADLNNKRRFGSIAEELITLVDSFNDPHVGICWDIGHGNRVYKNQVRPIRLLGDKIIALHVDDNHGTTDDHLLPFLGNIDWETIMPLLTEIGYKGDFVYEIKTNNYMPDELKNLTARFCYEVGEYLLALASLPKSGKVK
ncbi:sugar phosphate isomerase/epimerase family protein [Paenibacillus piri]|uniref:Sugar phosphate isomerase/epimerase n=1 Tax=Paenibacillus piri TaxID=2547395 RepID=A0A4R5KHV7_9BACL|nr:sugar phosphate isomerase/epimerase family protein [Paenibacillus piri]TDF93800.1 sugar phosphate isomerase/epimerase [Paenibacillus piri]